MIPGHALYSALGSPAVLRGYEDPSADPLSQSLFQAPELGFNGFPGSDDVNSPIIRRIKSVILYGQMISPEGDLVTDQLAGIHPADTVAKNQECRGFKGF